MVHIPYPIVIPNTVYGSQIAEAPRPVALQAFDSALELANTVGPWTSSDSTVQSYSIPQIVPKRMSEFPKIRDPNTDPQVVGLLFLRTPTRRTAICGNSHIDSHLCTQVTHPRSHLVRQPRTLRTWRRTAAVWLLVNLATRDVKEDRCKSSGLSEIPNHGPSVDSL